MPRVRLHHLAEHLHRLLVLPYTESVAPRLLRATIIGVQLGHPQPYQPPLLGVVPRQLCGAAQRGERLRAALLEEVEVREIEVESAAAQRRAATARPYT